MGSLKLSGTEEFLEKLRTVERRAPDRILDKLDEEGRRLRKQARANTPKITGNLRKGYRLLPIEKVKGGYQKGMTNKAPHFHLVEKGHRKVTPSGKEIGFTPGKFYLERTVKELEPIIAGELRRWLDALFRELR